MNKKHYTEHELLELLYEHKKHITTVSHWRAYSQEHDLPHAQTIIRYFGTWNNFKSKLSLDKNNQYRPPEFTEEDLCKLLEKYKEHYTSGTEWDRFAKINNLPNHNSFLTRLGADKLEKILNRRVVRRGHWNEESIAEVIRNYYPTKPPTLKQWRTEVPKGIDTPSVTTIIRHFKRWSNMQRVVYFKK